MRHPFKRYCFFLAEKLGKSLDDVMKLSSTEISEWMAYDMTNDEVWVKKVEDEAERKRQQELPMQRRADMMKKLLGGT